MPNAGIGKAVLAGLESNASKAGYHSLMVEMSKANLSGQRFFSRMGFEPAFSAATDLTLAQGLFLLRFLHHRVSPVWYAHSRTSPRAVRRSIASIHASRSAISRKKCHHGWHAWGLPRDTECSFANAIAKSSGLSQDPPVPGNSGSLIAAFDGFKATRQTCETGIQESAGLRRAQCSCTPSMAYPSARHV